MNQHLPALRQLFKDNENTIDAPIMKRYMRNKYEFFGIKKPLRLKIGKAFFKEYGSINIAAIPSFVKLLWEQPERELHYFGNDIMESRVKAFPKTYIDLMEYLITHQSWWDTVDTTAIRVVGEHFKRYPSLIIPYTKRWIASDNIWLQRTSIIFQLKYREKTNTTLLFGYAEQLGTSNEFFIQKGIGWALRAYSKTDAKAVIEFVRDTNIAAFSKKEALKWLKNKGRI